MRILARDNSEGVIYGISLKDETIRYVGLTSKSVEARLAEHLYTAQIRQRTPLDKWLTAHAGDPLEIHILAEVPREELAEHEELWIATLGTHVSRGGLNATYGGDGVHGHTVSDETRAKMRAASKIRHQKQPVSEETRSKLRDANLGKTLSPETRAKISEAGIGRVVSEETREKLRQANTGQKRDDSFRDRVSSGCKKSWDMSDASRREAARDRARWAAHVTWHVKRDVKKDVCKFCEN